MFKTVYLNNKLESFTEVDTSLEPWNNTVIAKNNKIFEWNSN